jgi:peroxiredoxin
MKFSMQKSRQYNNNAQTTILAVIFLLQLSSLKSQDNFRDAADVKGIEVGSFVKDFKAVNQFGEMFQLADALAKGPVIVIFYRGQWCPVCNKHLSNIQDSLSFIIQKGAQIIAVSPEKPEMLLKTVSKTNAEFVLLYDEDYRISKTFDVLFRPNATTRSTYNTLLGAHLKSSHSDETQQLPVPATFILDANHVVLFKHVDADYKIRTSVKEMLLYLN